MPRIRRKAWAPGVAIDPPRGGWSPGYVATNGQDMVARHVVRLDDEAAGDWEVET